MVSEFIHTYTCVSQGEVQDELDKFFIGKTFHPTSLEPQLLPFYMSQELKMS